MAFRGLAVQQLLRRGLRGFAADAPTAAAAASQGWQVWVQHRSNSSSSSSSSSSASGGLRGVEEELLLQLQQQKRLTVEEVLQSTQRLLQRQHTSFAHPSSSSSNSSSSSSSILPNEFVAFLSAAAAAAAEQQQRHVLLSDSRFQQLLQQLRSRLIGFDAPQLFRLLLSLARLQHCPPEVLERLLYILGGPKGGPPRGLAGAPLLPLQQLSPKQLAQLPLLLAAATGSCDPTLSRSCSAQQQQQQQQQRHLLLQPPGSELQAFLQVYVQRVCELLRLQQEALGPSPEASAAAAAAKSDAAAAAAAAGYFAAEDLCLLLIGMSSLGFRHLLLTDLAADALRLQLLLQFGGPTAPEELQQQQQQQQQPEEMVQQQLMLLPLPSVLLSLATLGSTNATAITEISYQLLRVAPLLSVSRLTDCLLALATLQTNPSAVPSLALLSEVEKQLTKRAFSCSLSDAVTAAFAAVALQLHRGSQQLLLELLQQTELLQQQDDLGAEDAWGELPLRQQQIALELSLDPKAKPLRELLQQKGLGHFAAFPATLRGEAVETQNEGREKVLLQEIEEFLQQEDVRHRLLLSVDALLQQQQKPQQKQQPQPEQQHQQQHQQPEQQQQQQQQEDFGEVEEASLRRVALSVQLKDFPCLRTYRVASLFVWPSAAAAAAAAEAAAAAAEVLQHEQQGGSSSSNSLAVVADFSTFAEFEGPAEVYVQLKYRHLRRAGHALIAVRAEEWAEANGEEERLELLLKSLQLPERI
ncbi:hypothetical protein, conserved [Eimeria tenella]|uniref:RAP domain-containing protein n=1 Tax=Eimeria tenella TaxID=5802 RepID=U6L544_EIMTE|nr:hypothetical protein, conserved [Eimeria tenella]CDJ45286.1 hypothetical protein, conserved [Eimeria tenella]|eukprot:XP_013236032.1 hypothetical protein, conserved [Eimeria tenella]